jgi:hypothetical protein
VLKGGGWYADLYSSSKPKSDGGESKPAKTSEGASSGSTSTSGGGDGGGGGGSSSTSGSGSSSSGPVNSAPKVAAAKA